MSMQYIRDYYKVPAYRGRKVRFHGKECVIVGSRNQYLKGKYADGWISIIHPTWEVEYIEEGKS
jgi:hypothetical protein